MSSEIIDRRASMIDKLCRIAGFALLVTSLSAVPAGSRPTMSSVSSVTTLLDRYERGEYEAVTAQLERETAAFARESRRELNRQMPEGSIPRMTDPLPLPNQFASDARRWIVGGGSPSVDRRRLVAATLALEIAHARRRLPTPAGATFATLACRLLRESLPPVPTEVERRWYLASVAVIEELYAWTLLAGPVSHFNPLATIVSGEAPVGHIAHARERFPDEPRFKLTLVVARDVQTEGVNLRPEVTAIGDPIRADEVPPATIADLRERARRNIGSRDQQNAADGVERLESLPQIASGYAELANVPEIRAEVELRFGYLAARLLAWDRAVEHLALVPTLTKDPDFVYASHYIRGWAHQRAGRRQEAIDAYRQAVAILPEGRSARMLLAAQLFLSDRAADRAAAHAEVQNASRLPQDADDPWHVFKRSEGRLWQERIAELREVLK